MKHSVIFDEYDPLALKPVALQEQYLALVEADVQQYLVANSRLLDVPCPACLDASVADEFVRCGLRYVECGMCASLYVSPRPDDTSISNYYERSVAGAFWRNQFSRQTSAPRTARVIKPRLQWIADAVAEYLPDAAHFADVNTNQSAYLSEIQDATFCPRKILIEPMVDVTDVDSTRLRVVREPIHEVQLSGSIDALSIFEVAERTSDVDRLFTAIHRLLRPGGLCFMTGTLSSGFDIQVLAKTTRILHPPDRLNVFSIEGLKAIFARCGFECLELSTPGIFDVANVEAAWRRDPAIALPRFVRYFLQCRDEPVKQAFQQFLQGSLLSSHGRAMLRKPAPAGPEGSLG